MWHEYSPKTTRWWILRFNSFRVNRLHSWGPLKPNQVKMGLTPVCLGSLWWGFRVTENIFCMNTCSVNGRSSKSAVLLFPLIPLLLFPDQANRWETISLSLWLPPFLLFMYNSSIWVLLRSRHLSSLMDVDATGDVEQRTLFSGSKSNFPMD